MAPPDPHPSAPLAAALSGAWATDVFARLPPRALRERYDPGGTLAQGGSGRVERGWDRVLDRAVAIKRALRPEQAEALVQEARITALLAGPGVPPVHDSGQDDAGPWFVMALLPGSSLRDRLPVESAEALLGLVHQAAEVVARAHARGLLHLDLKPDNLFVDEQDKLTVLDWGLARETGSAPRAGSVTGTAPYMGPQQWRGEPAAPTDDVWALGAVLLEGLTGAPPFGALGDAERRHRVCQEPVPLDGVPPRLRPLLARCLALEADLRFPDAAALATALEAVRHPASGPAVPSAPSRPPPRLAALAIAALALCAVALLAVALVQGRAAVEARHTAAALLAKEQQSLALLARAAADRDDQATAVRLAREALDIGASPLAQGVLLRFAPDSLPAPTAAVPLRGCEGPARRTSSGVVCINAHASPDARLVGHDASGAPQWTVPLPPKPLQVLAAGDSLLIYENGVVQRVDPASGRILGTPRLSESLPRVHLVAGPDRLLAWGARTRMLELDTLSEEPLALCAGFTQAATAREDTLVAICRDGTVVRSVGGVVQPPVPLPASLPARALESPELLADGSLAVLQSGRSLLRIDLQSGGVQSLATLAGRRRELVVHGDRVLISTLQAATELRALRTGLLLASFPHVGATALSLTDTTAEMVEDGVLYRYALPESFSVDRFEAPVGVFPARLSPDGQTIAAAGVDGQLYTWSRDGSQAAAIPVSARGQALKWLSFSPEGDRVAVSVIGDEHSSLVDLEAGRATTPFLPATNSSRRLLWLQGLLVAALYDDSVAAWTPEGTPVPGLSMRLEVAEMVASADRSVALLGAESGEIFRIHAETRAVAQLQYEPELSALALSPSGRSWALATPQAVRVFAGESGQVPFPLPQPVRALALDDRHVYLGFSDGRIEARQHDGSLVAVMEGHDDILASLQVSADGTLLLSASWDGRVRVWQLGALHEGPATR